MPVCPKCHRLISDKKNRRHLKRCGTKHRRESRPLQQPVGEEFYTRTWPMTRPWAPVGSARGLGLPFDVTPERAKPGERQLMKSGLMNRTPSGLTSVSIDLSFPNMFGSSYRGQMVVANRNLILGLLAIAFLLASSCLVVPVMAESPSFAVGSVVRVTQGASPFTPGCNGSPQSGTVYMNSEVEPYVAVNPTNPLNVVGVWQQDRWSNGGANGAVTGYSDDGGATWTLTWAHFSHCSGGKPSNGGNYERVSDPWVTFSPNGVAYESVLGLNFTFNSASSVLVSRSTNGGVSWSNPKAVILDKSSSVLNDKDSITADPTNSSYVYAVWDRLAGSGGPTYFARSTDGGQTWETARSIYNPGSGAQTIGNQIVVLPDGALVDVFNLIKSGSSVAIIRSTDKGVTWSKPIVVASFQSVGVLDPRNGQPIRSGGDVIPEVAVDPTSGNLYAVWQDGRFSSFSYDSVAFSMSTDGGLHWSTPVRVNQSPKGVPGFTPMVSVAANGVVAVTYYDFRHYKSGDTNLPTNYWIVHCSASCTTPSNWSENKITGSFDLETAPSASGYFLGDYQGLTSSGNTFVPFFIRANSGNLHHRTDVFTTTAG